MENLREPENFVSYFYFLTAVTEGSINTMLYIHPIMKISQDFLIS